MANVLVFSQDIEDMDMDVDIMVDTGDTMDVDMDTIEVRAMEVMDGLNNADMIQKCTYIHNYV